MHHGIVIDIGALAIIFALVVAIAVPSFCACAARNSIANRHTWASVRFHRRRNSTTPATADRYTRRVANRVPRRCRFGPIPHVASGKQVM